MNKKIIVGLLAVGLCSGAFAASDHSKQFYGQFGLGGYVNHSYTESGPAVSGTVGYGITKNLAAQASFNYMTHEQKAVLVEGIWNFVNNTNFTPYVAVGGGYMDFTTHSLGLDAGVGVKYDFASNAYISADYRYLQSFGSKTPNGSLISIGLGLYFGGANHSMANEQSMREHEYHSAYALPQHVMECQDGTSQMTRESIGCYTVDGDEVTMHLDAKFDYGSHALNTKSKAAIDSLLNFVKEYDVKKVVLQGFASQGKTGPAYAKYNQELSENRAQEVKSYMVSKGLDADSVEVVGYGYSNPKVPNTTKENKSINQRVEASVPVPLKAE